MPLRAEMHTGQYCPFKPYPLGLRLRYQRCCVVICGNKKFRSSTGPVFTDMIRSSERLWVQGTAASTFPGARNNWRTEASDHARSYFYVLACSVASEPQLLELFLHEARLKRPLLYQSPQGSGVARFEGSRLANGGFRGRDPAWKGKLTRTSKTATANLIDRHRSHLSLALRTICERGARCFHSSGIDLYALHKLRLILCSDGMIRAAAQHGTSVRPMPGQGNGGAKGCGGCPVLSALRV
jgi:hypothetical protein